MTAAHQPEIRQRGGKLAVTCPCLLTRTRLPDAVAAVPYWKRDGDAQPFRSVWERGIIESRTRFPAAEAIAAWRTWHAERNVAV